LAEKKFLFVDENGANARRYARKLSSSLRREGFRDFSICSLALRDAFPQGARDRLLNSDHVVALWPHLRKSYPEVFEASANLIELNPSKGFFEERLKEAVREKLR
jgi:hypothetical protein